MHLCGRYTPFVVLFSNQQLSKRENPTVITNENPLTQYTIAPRVKISQLFHSVITNHCYNEVPIRRFVIIEVCCNNV